MDETGRDMQKKQRNASVPTFLRKLFQILSSSNQAGVVEWSNDGLKFEVLNRHQFTTGTLPEYFKHSNINSFVRQLNMYDFHKCKRSTEEIQFRHPFF